jgi:predicted nucleic acid-binding Zn ribbon protein
MTKRRSPRPVEAALAPLRNAWAPETLLAEVQRVWPGIVGDVIAAEARPVSERGGVVTVVCSAAVWAQELDLMAGEIVPRLAAAVHRGQVRKLRCVAG